MAAQTLSSSVAKALDFVRDIVIEGFEDVDPTILLIQTIDHLFDVLNSRTPFAPGFKRPISLANYTEIEQFLSFAKELILSLEANGQPLVSSPRHTGFVGFIFCIESFLALSKELLTQEHPLKYVLSYKFSQDHLELLFNAIRGALGWNDNPTPKQFGFVMRRLNAHPGISADSTGNCVNLSDSGRSDEVQPEDIFENDDFNPPSSTYITNVISYIAGFVVKKVLRHDKCPECRVALISSTDDVWVPPEERHFIRLKDNGGLLMPSLDVTKVLKLSESVFSSLPLRKQNPTAVSSYVINRLPFDVFSSPHMVEHDHRSRVVRSLVHSYCDLRSFHYAKQAYLNRTGYKRPTLTKQIHFLSQ